MLATRFAPLPYCFIPSGLLAESIFMQIESAKLDKGVVMKVSGRMDAENAHEFQSACSDWIAKGNTRLILDLSELKYVSSMGLSHFLAAAKELNAKAGALILCGLQGSPRQVFELTKLIGLFPVFDTVDAAVATL